MSQDPRGSAGMMDGPIPMTRWQRFKCWLGFHNLFVNQEWLDRLAALEDPVFYTQIIMLRGMPVICLHCGRTGWHEKVSYE